MSLVQSVKLSNFAVCDVDPTGKNPSDIDLGIPDKETELPLSVFTSDRILGASQTPSGDILDDSWTEEEFSALLLSYLFGATCTEQGSFLVKPSIYQSYASKVARRVSNNQDTGLIHPDTLNIASTMSTQSVNNSLAAVVSAARSFKEFPSVAKMNVISTLDDIEVDFGAEYLKSFIPVCVESAGGVTAIFPTMNSAGKMYASHCCRILHDSLSYDIDRFHIWDIPANKMRQASAESAATAQNIIARAAKI